MKKNKQFKVGATYKLKNKYATTFNWTPSLLSRHQGKPFVFTVGSLSRSGIAWSDSSLIIATASERYMFKRIDNK